jgi:sugar O-acyltransferase (sialic acid O-acetyltransferase NeuD family)
VIVGAGGFGREVLDIIEAVNNVEPTWDFLGYLDDGEPAQGLLARREVKHLGPSGMLASIEADYVIGIASADARARIDALATSVGRSPAILVHPSAVIGSDVEIMSGSIVCAHVSISTHVRLGRHVQLNAGCTIGHDAVFEDFVTIFPGAAVSGNVLLHDGSTVGAGSVVLQGLEVGSGSMVGAGAVVARSVPDGSTVVGVPARPVMDEK